MPPKAIRFDSAARPDNTNGDASAAVVAFLIKVLRLKGFSFDRIIESIDNSL
jgi:hypothetical protein